MIKKLYYFISFFAVTGFSLPCFSQNTAPDIVWQRCIGGSLIDHIGRIIQIGDGNFVLAGWTQSSDGDVSCQPGTDLFIMKLAHSGEILWQRCFDSHFANRLYATDDGGFIVIGSTLLNGCGNNHGGNDAWMAKMDTHGEFEWQRCFGGTLSDGAEEMRQTSDGGFILVGQASSNDGDVSGNHGEIDAWVVKLDAEAEIEWQRCLGGSKDDYARDVKQTLDGGYILALQTNSVDGNVSGNNGHVDYWVVRLDDSGEILWQKCLGGYGWEYVRTVHQTSDGGFLVVGSADSEDGDVTGNHGAYDCWVVKLDGTGELQWKKCYGGTSWDTSAGAFSTDDGGFILMCETSSDDGDISFSQGNSDAWLVKIDAEGEILWQKTYGGSNNDGAHNIEPTLDGGLIMLGFTNSNDGDVSGFHGGIDYWVVKLGDGAVSVKESDIANDIHIYPSPNQGLLTVEINGRLTDDNTVELALFSVDGRLLRSETVKKLNGPFSHSFDCGDVTSGVYLMRFGTLLGTVYKKVVVQR